MPKAPSDEQAPVPEAPARPLLAFSYPTIGDGVTIYAYSQKEADELARKHPLFRA